MFLFFYIDKISQKILNLRKMRIQNKSDTADVVNCIRKWALVTDQEKVDTEQVVEEAVPACRSFVPQNCTF